MFNQLIRQVFLNQYNQLQKAVRLPINTQQTLLFHLLNKAKNTEWGQRYHFNKLKTLHDFSSAVPLGEYESFRADILRMMHGKANILWPGCPSWFSKSSGTTGGKSKFIPVTRENLKGCHLKGTWDTMGIYYHHRPKARQFAGKTMLMGGSWNTFENYPHTRIGDVSAIMIERMPAFANSFYIPEKKYALLPNWEEKLEFLAQAGAREKDVVMIGGVPTWTVVLFRRILEITGKQHMLEVWPNFQLYSHGGVSFKPYQQQFHDFFPSDKVDFLEVYNASEGYFAVQDQLDNPEAGMLLLLNNGVFYEFLPMSEWEKPTPTTCTLEEVETGKNYALVISTNAGLWRYIPGDTITFTSTNPYRIRITGRTRQFINAFGEEVIVENADQAIALTCAETRASVTEYSVAPVYFQTNNSACHQWLIEFDKEPASLEQFSALLDQHLQKINSDYEAKRFKDIALAQLRVEVMPSGTFMHWLKQKGKLGGQHKVPRLSNNREVVEDILSFLQKSRSSLS